MIMAYVAFAEQHSGISFYPHSFPMDAGDEVGVVKLMPMYGQAKGGVGTAQLQVIIRSTHPEKAELIATTMMKSVDNLTSFNIGDNRIIQLSVTNPFPLFVGKDENNRFKYSFDVKVLLEK
ncbi:minor capsid protein [Cytobacillus firmus]|nr:minor capsid protein [Cytobacillus firmus]